MTTSLTITVVSYKDKICTYGSVNGFDMYQDKFNLQGRTKRAFFQIQTAFEQLGYAIETIQYRDPNTNTVRPAFTACKEVDRQETKSKYDFVLKTIKLSSWDYHTITIPDFKPQMPAPKKKLGLLSRFFFKN